MSLDMWYDDEMHSSDDEDVQKLVKFKKKVETWEEFQARRKAEDRKEVMDAILDRSNIILSMSPVLVDFAGNTPSELRYSEDYAGRTSIRPTLIESKDEDQRADLITSLLCATDVDEPLTTMGHTALHIVLRPSIFKRSPRWKDAAMRSDTFQAVIEACPDPMVKDVDGLDAMCEASLDEVKMVIEMIKDKRPEILRRPEFQAWRKRVWMEAEARNTDKGDEHE